MQNNIYIHLVLKELQIYKEVKNNKFNKFFLSIYIKYHQYHIIIVNLKFNSSYKQFICFYLLFII